MQCNTRQLQKVERLCQDVLYGQTAEIDVKLDHLSAEFPAFIRDLLILRTCFGVGPLRVNQEKRSVVGYCKKKIHWERKSSRNQHVRDMSREC